MDQIQSLTEISAGCHQEIIHNCTNNVLTGLSWWNDRNGNKINYWDGSHSPETVGCRCSLEQDGCDPDAFGDSVSFYI